MASVDANGNPMISYPGLSDDLNLTTCDLAASTNGNCDQPADWSTMTLDAEANGTDMTVADNGNPMISYLGLSDGLKFAICDLSESVNGNCAQPADWSKATVDDDAGYVGNNTAIAVNASTNPIISYWQSANDAVKFAMCDLSESANGNCDQAADWSTETVDAEENVGRWTSIAAAANGDPMISYYGGSDRDLKFAIGFALPVGGVAELPAAPGSPSPNHILLAGVTAAALLALSAGAWYAGRRWLR
jgi:hypothetical protein